MKIQLIRLEVHTRKSTEVIEFSKSASFIYGPISKGKSTVARLIDFCFGGELERTPAIQQEFVTTVLHLVLGKYNCSFERAASDNSTIRVNWSDSEDSIGSVNAPLQSNSESLIADTEVYLFSDLIYYLCGVEPIKVRQRSRDYESPLIRLSIRDLWRYCYLEQIHLDSSFFRFEDAFRGRKSQDAMRFFTGLYSERLSQLESDLMKSIDEQRGKREAVKQIRLFMEQFSLGSENDITEQMQSTEVTLENARCRRAELLKERNAEIHPTDPLRKEIVALSDIVFNLQVALSDSIEIINQQKSLQAELITAKAKNDRIAQAGLLFDDVQFECCPECGLKITAVEKAPDSCRLCGKSHEICDDNDPSIDYESIRKDLNHRIDELTDSIKRRESDLARTIRQIDRVQTKKVKLDYQLQEELNNYDSAIIESIRYIDREIATLEERLSSLHQLQLMPQAINKLEEEAGALQGTIDRLRSELENEKKRLSEADACVNAIAEKFKEIMLSVKFPGVYPDDDIIIDPRNWRPEIIHGDTYWSFWDTGSGGKKTLFNVCYALSIHSVAKLRNMPVPTLLIIDSPTKNISDDENPELVKSLYDEIYNLALEQYGYLQLLLIDSDLVIPANDLPEFSAIHMAGTKEAPSLISYYDGP